MFRGYINITIDPSPNRLGLWGCEMTKLDPLEYSMNGPPIYIWINYI